MVENRKCDKCDKILPLIKEYWHANKSSTDGFRNPCKECHNKELKNIRAKDPEKARRREKIWRSKNPDKVKQNKKKDYEKNRESYRSKSRQWRENNLERDAEVKHERYVRLKDEIKEYNHNYYLENCERIKKNVEEWAHNNPEKFKSIQAKRRDLQNKVDAYLPPEYIELIFSAFDNKCFKCGKTEKLCLDHHYPLSKGYGLNIENAVILCKSCNSTKHDALPEKFYSIDELKTINEIFKKIGKMI